MAIDICFVKQNAKGELEQDGDEAERVAHAAGFFNLMQMLTHLMPMVDALEQNDPKLRPHLQPFRLYLAQEREARLARFAAFVDFLHEDLARMRELAGGAVVLDGPRATFAADDFDADLRVFVAGLMLSDKAHGPQDLPTFIPFLGIMRGLLRHGGEAFAADQPQAAEAMHDAAECLGIVTRFCDAAMASGRHVYFSC